MLQEELKINFILKCGAIEYIKMNVQGTLINLLYFLILYFISVIIAWQTCDNFKKSENIIFNINL